MINDSQSPPQAILANKVEGVIRSVTRQIAEVEIESDSLPFLYEILSGVQDPEVQLEVYLQQRNLVSCLILSNPFKLYRGMKVYGSESELKIPVGYEILGRAIN